MAQAVAMPQGAAWGRPERATDPQAAWRKTRNNPVRSCGYVGNFKVVFEERTGKRGGHHVSTLGNESNRAEIAARWRDAMR